MRITAGQLYDAVHGLNSILDAQRPRMIPQVGKFRLAKLHTILERHYVLIEAQRAAIVQKLGHEVFTDEAKTKSGGWSVEPGTPPFDQYIKEWNAVREQELEVDVKPITLTMLGNDPRGIEAGECKMLEPFIDDNVPE
jgi:hypothetical protein